ncbi:hypothetical protein [Agromyces sp. GXS1127]|uniref:hypothetical protein n=1 Tax=Agromyces sp. GXS1127 TaxID=3424181 RepID=UPI003D324548
MPYSVREYAERLGISRAAAFKRVRSGGIGAYRIGSQWVVPDEAVSAPTPVSRPMSPGNARRLLASVSGVAVAVDDAVVRRRIAEKTDRVLRGDVDPMLLWSWVRERAPRLALHAREVDLADLLADPRLVPSGLSDPRGAMASAASGRPALGPAPTARVDGGRAPAASARLETEPVPAPSDRPAPEPAPTPSVVEGYVSPAALDALVTEFLLVQTDRPNVWVHVADIPTDVSGRAPIGFTIADLLDHGGPRERAHATVLLHTRSGDGGTATPRGRGRDAIRAKGTTRAARALGPTLDE